MGYATLLALGQVPEPGLAAAGAFAVLGLALFALTLGDPAWTTQAPRTAALAPTRARAALRSRLPSPSAVRPRPSEGAIPRPFGVSVSAPPAILPLSSGDLLWTRLTPTSEGTLPVELVGPSADSAYAPTAEEIGQGDLAGGEAWAPGGAEGMAALTDWGGFSAPAGGWSATRDEALNLTPPHLREAPPAWKEVRGPRAPAPTGPPPEGVHCATCRRSLSNPPAWRSCSSCHRPFCGDCAFRARRATGSGRCRECRDPVEIEQARFIA